MQIIKSQAERLFVILGTYPYSFAETAQKHSCEYVCMQRPLPWKSTECISLARVLQQMAHLLKQQPLYDSSVQQVSIIAQCSDVMFHLLLEMVLA